MKVVGCQWSIVSKSAVAFALCAMLLAITVSADAPRESQRSEIIGGRL
jgi:hypothetical protein